MKGTGSSQGREAGDARVHRALSSQVRVRLLDVLRRQPDLDAAALAERLDLHVNTVRTHLAMLEDAGLVVAQVEERDRPGRPRLLYRVTDEAASSPAVADDRGYRFLAGVLASYLHANVEDSAGAAEQAGAAWGKYVIGKPPPFQEVEPDDAVGRLLAMLEEFGFEPVLDDRDAGAPRVVLRRCPFLDVAREHEEVVCSVHLGLMRGALEELGVDVVAEDLIPWAEPQECVTRLRMPAG